MTEADQNLFELMAWSFLVNPEPQDANDVARDLAEAFLTLNNENMRLKQHRSELEEQLRIKQKQNQKLMLRSEKTDHLAQIFNTDHKRKVGKPRVKVVVSDNR